MRAHILENCSALALIAAFGLPPTLSLGRTWLDGEPYEVKEDAGLDALVKSISTHNDVVKSRLDKVDAEIDEMKAHTFDLAQSMASRSHFAGGASAPRTIGNLVKESEEIRSVSSNWKGRARIELKATITSATADAAGSAGALVVADRQDGAILMPQRKLRMRDLFAPGETESNAIEWPKQKLRTNNAATVAEGGLKPQSDVQFEMKQWPVRTIAHWVLASRQILDDVPALVSLIDSDLTYGLKDVEDNQLLNGGGTGQDLSGVYTTAVAFAAPFTMSAPTMIDVLLLAIAQMDGTNYETDGIVLNPLDWRKIQAIKDTTGRYIGGGPFSDLVARLWQMPVVTTTGMSQDKFLVGAFRQGGQIFDRQEATVELSTEDSDNFRKNLVTVLCEERLAFVKKHEDAFVKGDFSDAITASTAAP